MEEENGKASLGMKILCFFVPLAGLIIYASDKEKRPIFARDCGMLSLIGFIVRYVAILFFVIFTAVIMPGIILIGTTQGVLIASARSGGLSNDCYVFNTKFTRYEGTINGSQAKALITNVKTNNKVYTNHKVTLKFEGEKIDPDDASKLIKSGYKYYVQVDYDSNGYVNKVIIDKL